MFFSFKVYTLWSLQNSMTFSNFSVKCTAEVCFNIRRTRAFPPRLLFLTFHYQDMHFMTFKTWNISQKFMTFQVTMATQTLFTIQPPDRVLNLTTDKEKKWTGKCTLIVMKFFRDLDILHPSIVK